MVVFKYILTHAEVLRRDDGLRHLRLTLPKGAALLRVGVDNAGSPALWALVDRDAPRQPRELLIVGTGRETGLDGGWIYVGTYKNGPYFYHCFDLGPS